MGGLGSGRKISIDKKRTIEGLPFIDVRQLQKQGCIKPYTEVTMTWTIGHSTFCSIMYRVTVEAIQLSYRHRSTKGSLVDTEQMVFLDQTACNYGGMRRWFLCPECNRRVAILYYSGKGFYCRHCHNLTYACQQEGKSNRMRRKALKIRQALGYGDSLFTPIEIKPKGMHYTTFNRLRKKAEEIHCLAWSVESRIIEKHSTMKCT